MLITWNYPAVGFFHMMKTGGRSARKVFRHQLGSHNFVYSKVVGGHYSLSELVDSFDIDLTHHTIYTTIRNPYSRVVSEYMWLKGGLNDVLMKNQFLALIPKLIDIKDMEFSEFVDWYLENRASYQELLFVNGKLPTTIRFIRLETLREDLEKIFGAITYLPHIYNMKNKHHSEYFTHETYIKINKKYDWCFKVGLYQAL